MGAPYIYDISRLRVKGVICLDARRGSVLFEARIPSSESKRVCAAAKRKVDTRERMTLFGTVRLLLSKKSLEFTALIACYIIERNHFLLVSKFELLQMSICDIFVNCNWVATRWQ